MRRLEKEKKLPPYAVAALYICIGCSICSGLFLIGSSFSRNSATSVFFQTAKNETETSETPESPEIPPADAGTLDESEETPLEVSVSDTPAEEEHYYSFVTLNTQSSLHVRVQPGMDAEIIARLSPGTTGYIIEKGSEWSLIQTDGITGYASNRYLEIQEIPKEEYPSQ